MGSGCRPAGRSDPEGAAHPCVRRVRASRAAGRPERPRRGRPVVCDRRDGPRGRLRSRGRPREGPAERGRPRALGDLGLREPGADDALRPPENVDRVLRIFDLYDVPATVIGRVIPEKVCRVRYQGTVVLEMDLVFYTGGPEYTRPYKPPATRPSQDLRLPREPQDYRSTILKILASPNVASKEYVIRQYDHEVRASTVLKPLQGVIGKASHGDASVIRPLVDSWRALAISVASTPHFTAIDPYRGGATAVDEVCRNLVAVGANPHSLTNCLNFGNPEKPDRLWFFRE